MRAAYHIPMNVSTLLCFKARIEFAKFCSAKEQSAENAFVDICVPPIRFCMIQVSLYPQMHPFLEKDAAKLRFSLKMAKKKERKMA